MDKKSVTLSDDWGKQLKTINKGLKKQGVKPLKLSEACRVAMRLLSQQESVTLAESVAIGRKCEYLEK